MKCVPSVLCLHRLTHGAADCGLSISDVSARGGVEHAGRRRRMARAEERELRLVLLEEWLTVPSRRTPVRPVC